MKEERGEGIVLRATPFSDTKKILTVFMPEEGIISLATRTLSPQVSRLASATAPLTCSEFLFRQGKGEVYRLIEAHVLVDHLGLRNHIERLDGAGEIVQILLKTQLPGKPSPLLYELTKAILDRLQHSPKTANLVGSFHLKLLKHEGLLRWTPHCSVCNAQPVTFFSRGEGHCSLHRKDPAQPFSSIEWDCLGVLCASRSFNQIENLSLPMGLLDKIRATFLDIF